jgi:hypothetical protein
MTGPEEAARKIADARARLLTFADGCSVQQWGSSPLGEADPRSVSVVVDHVADAYDYIYGWMRTLVGGGSIEVSPEIVDELNAAHAAKAGVIDIDEVVAHLSASGDVLIEFVGKLSADDLTIDEGRVALFCEIAARHADSHRAELEAGLA